MSVHDRRQATERRILEALGAELASEGFRGLGVNAVARRAGVSKELIYRYFGGLDALLAEFMRRRDYWSAEAAAPVTDRGGASPGGAKARIDAMLAGQLRRLRAHEDLREIRRWELGHATDATRRLADGREAASLDFVGSLGLEEDPDAAGKIGILLAGLLYLSLRSKTAPQFFGLDLTTEAGWEEIEALLGRMVERLFDDPERAEPPAPAGGEGG